MFINTELLYLIQISAKKLFFMPHGLLTKEYQEYAIQTLRIAILGGVRLDGLDRLRVTLKIESTLSESEYAIRQNLDLYDEGAVERLARKISERLGGSEEEAREGLQGLTDTLERQRLSKLEASGQIARETEGLSESERQRAIDHLKAKDLHESTLQGLKDLGIVGEEKNALILFYAMSGRKLNDPVSVMCLARSGLGKSYLMERVSKCMPIEDVIEQTMFTGASLYHFEREEIKSKIFLIEDLEGAENVLFPIRELQTKKRISKTMTIKDGRGKLKTVQVVVEGPVCVVGCTTSEKLYEDNANRTLLIYLDESKEQDGRIMAYQKQKRAGLIDEGKQAEVKGRLQNMQRVLRPVRIVNPYAPLIDLPKSVFKPRRTLPLLLSFIESITYYHQYQRQEKVDESTGELYIEVSVQDVARGVDLLEEVLKRKSDELSKATRSFYDRLKKWCKAENLKDFQSRALRESLRMAPRTLNRYLAELKDYGLIEIVGGSKHKGGYEYKLRGKKDYSKVERLMSKELQSMVKRIESACAESAMADSGVISN